ncbi:hypothetical protein, partial [Pseudomonas viridiflava]|uniref:hypothetical protein n=1 Tax=Pseudomonas viridiflava TaxID=33069 RepID=UPI001981EC26
TRFGWLDPEDAAELFRCIPFHFTKRFSTIPTIAGRLSRDMMRASTIPPFAWLGSCWNVEEPFTAVMMSSSSPRSFPASNTCLSSSSAVSSK